MAWAWQPKRITRCSKIDGFTGWRPARDGLNPNHPGRDTSPQGAGAASISVSYTYMVVAWSGKPGAEKKKNLYGGGTWD